MLLFRLRFPGFSPSLRPGFPCLPSGSVYSAFCQFPFTLPCFTPTAVPQVLAWLHSPFGSLRFSISPFSFRFLSSASFPGSITQPSVSSFPFFPFLPHGGFPGAYLSAFSSVCFHTSVSALVLSFSCFFLSPLTVSHHRCYFSCRPPVSSSADPLSLRLRFWLLGKGLHPQN